MLQGDCVQANEGNDAEARNAVRRALTRRLSVVWMCQQKRGGQDFLKRRMHTESGRDASV